jgi:hypothetical protein
MWIIAITLLFVYGQRIQIFLALRRIGKDLKKLERMSLRAKEKLMEKLLEYGEDEVKVKAGVEKLLNTFFIQPTKLDPKGIVYKLDKLLKAYDDLFREKVYALAPKADEVKRLNLTNLAEVTFALESIYKIVRHYYTSAKKFNDMFAIVMLQIQLPMIMELADAYFNSLEAFAKGVAIGDSLGPMVASQLAGGSPFREVAKETVVAETKIEGRKVIIMKAKGPGGTVGRPGEAIERLLQLYEVSTIITVDAGLKLHGEDSGEVVEGIGVAVGGPGVDRFKIEEIATKKNIPLYAVIIKMSEKEAVGEMKEELKTAVNHAVERVKRIIRERTKEEDIILVAGIGNTIGVP